MPENENFESRIDLTGIQHSVAAINTEVQKLLVGQQDMLDFLIAAILANGHVLLEGVPGIAKTLTAKLLAHSVDIGFSRIQFTPDLMPSDVLGTSVFNMKTSEFEFNKGPIFSNLILIDEINRAPAKTQAALFEVMEERQVTVDGTTWNMQAPFIVVGTQNPIDQEGTYRLPEAQVDRFLFKIEVEYPSQQEETDFLTRTSEEQEPNDLSKITPVLRPEQLADYQLKVRQVHLKRELVDYIVKIVHQTRQTQSVYLGASPRGSLAIVSGAKALAAMRGRDFVIPEDIQEVVYPALRHRLILAPEAEMEGLTADDVLKQLIHNIEVPR